VLHAAWPEWSRFRLHAVGAVVVLALGVAAVRALSSEITDEL
jgi:hypothetical protein